MNIRKIALATLVCAAALGLQATGEERKLTFAERLGFTADTKVLIIHLDDLGITQGQNDASLDVLKAGMARSASVIVTSPLAKEAIEQAREAGFTDLGIHVALNSEASGPLLFPAAGARKVWSLTDLDGYLTRHLWKLASIGKAKHVEREINEQIKLARSWGLQPTHMDSHMGTIFFYPSWFFAYLNVAKQQRIPPMIPRWSENLKKQMGWAARPMGWYVKPLAKAAEKAGHLLLDDLYLIPPPSVDAGIEARKAQYIDVLRKLKPGVSEIIVHAAYTDRDGQRERVANFPYDVFRDHEAKIFQSEEIQEILRQEKIKVVGWAEIQKAYPWDQLQDAGW